MRERTAIMRSGMWLVCGGIAVGICTRSEGHFMKELEQFKMQKRHEQKATSKDEKQTERDVV